MSKGNKRVLWTLVFIALTFFCIWFMVRKEDASFWGNFINSIRHAKPLMIVGALLGMAGFIFFEALALWSILKSVGHRRKFRNNVVYSSADIYFSAITPSATGGQPVSALFMHRDGIPGAVVTATLILNLVAYTMAILFVGILAVVFRFDIFLAYGFWSRILIILGFVVLLCMLLGFMFLLRSGRALKKIIMGLIGFAEKLHIIKHKEEREKRIDKMVSDYGECTALFHGKKGLIWKVFLWDLLQRASQIIVSVFVYLAMGGSLRTGGKVWFIQSYSAIGSNCVPIPGAIGVADHLMLEGYEMVLPRAGALNMELLSRGIGFYGSVLLSLILIIPGYFALSRNKEK